MVGEKLAGLVHEHELIAHQEHLGKLGQGSNRAGAVDGPAAGIAEILRAVAQQGCAAIVGQPFNARVELLAVAVGVAVAVHDKTEKFSGAGLKAGAEHGAALALDVALRQQAALIGEDEAADAVALW